MHRFQRIGRRRWIAVGGLLVLIAIGVIAYVIGGPAPATDGRATGEHGTPPAGVPVADSSTASVDHPVPSPDVPTHLAPPPATGDADEYSVAVAEVMLGMDQRDHSPSDYWAWVRDARDPDSTDVIPAMTEASFESAVAQRIPTEAMWRQMQDSGQWAEFETENVWEPQYIRDKYASGAAPAGALMRNVAGTQTLHFIDEDGEPASREQTRTISILMACAPIYDECRLLAISSGVVE